MNKLSSFGAALAISSCCACLAAQAQTPNSTIEFKKKNF